MIMGSLLFPDRALSIKYAKAQVDWPLNAVSV